MTNGKYFKLLCNSDLMLDPPKLAVNHPRTAQIESESFDEICQHTSVVENNRQIKFEALSI